MLGQLNILCVSKPSIREKTLNSVSHLHSINIQVTTLVKMQNHEINTNVFTALYLHVPSAVEKMSSSVGIHSPALITEDTLKSLKHNMKISTQTCFVILTPVTLNSAELNSVNL